jgi:transcriptional regulator with XRE-family HTH domain
LEPETVLGTYTLVIGSQSNPCMVPLWESNIPLSGHTSTSSAQKSTPALTGVRAGAKSVIKRFFLLWGFSIGNVWENFSDVRLAFPSLKLFESGQTEPCLGSLATLAKAFGLGLAKLLGGRLNVEIDDPLEQIRRIANEENSDFVGTALQAAGLFAPVFKVVAIAKGVLDKQLNGSSLKAAILALCDELQRLQSHWPSDFESALETAWFRRAVATLMDVAQRAANDDHARLLARVTAHGCFPTGQDAHRQEDLASYIHDLARLGADDIRFLKLLREAYQKVEVGSHVGYSSYYKGYEQKAQNVGFEEDDLIALDTRLSGFGLAYEPSVQILTGHYFVLAYEARPVPAFLAGRG